MNPMAYGHMDSHYTYEHLFLLTEMDYSIHNAVASGVGAGRDVDTTTFFPVYWFINGRCAPDTMLADGVPWLPHQPYGSMAMMHPGRRSCCGSSAAAGTCTPSTTTATTR